MVKLRLYTIDLIVLYAKTFVIYYSIVYYAIFEMFEIGYYELSCFLNLLKHCY